MVMVEKMMKIKEQTQKMVGIILFCASYVCAFVCTCVHMCTYVHVCVCDSIAKVLGAYFSHLFFRDPGSVKENICNFRNQTQVSIMQGKNFTHYAIFPILTTMF